SACCLRGNGRGGTGPHLDHSLARPPSLEASIAHGFAETRTNITAAACAAAFGCPLIARSTGAIDGDAPGAQSHLHGAIEARRDAVAVALALLVTHHHEADAIAIHQRPDGFGRRVAVQRRQIRLARPELR